MHKDYENSFFEQLPDGPKLPTPNPLIQHLTYPSASELARLYDRSMSELTLEFSGSGDNISQSQKSSLEKITRRLDMLLFEAERFSGYGTEIWLQSDSGITTSDPDIIRQAIEESGDLGIENLPDRVGFHIPAVDGVQFFFDGFTIEKVFDPISTDSEATLPFILSIKASGLLIHPADPNVQKMYIPGNSIITPQIFENVQFGIVYK